MVEWLSLIHYNNRPDTVYQICQQPGVSCYQFIIVVRVSPISLGSHDRTNILRYRFHNTWPIKKAKWYNSSKLDSLKRCILFIGALQFIIVLRYDDSFLRWLLHDERWSVFSSVLRANLMEQAFSVLMYSRPLITLCTIESVAILRSSWTRSVLLYHLAFFIGHVLWNL
jgi:hypothetical protein